MSGAPRAPVTAVIAARNEAAHIEACVRSLDWASEVIVVENDSTDSTVELARAAGARVISNPFVSIGAQRNAAISQASNEWVLVVDADERCTPELASEIATVVDAPAGTRAYRVPRRNFFLGKEVRHGGWDSDRPVRLIRRELRYDDSRVHERVVVSGTPPTLHSPLLHYTYSSLDQYFEKFNRYSRDWAEQNFARGRRTGVSAVVLKPPAKFVTMYLLRGGWRDGATGVVAAALAAASVLAKYARLWERSRRATPG